MTRLAGTSIDRRAVKMDRVRLGEGAYDDEGEWLEGAPDPEPIKAVIQPMSGNQLQDLPEGVRTEAKWICWSRSELACDDDRNIFDKIIYGESEYRVLFVWPRNDGGFYRAALGKL